MGNLKATFDYEPGYEEDTIDDLIIEKAAEILVTRLKSDTMDNIRGVVQDKIGIAIEENIDQLMVKKIPVYDSYGDSTKEYTTLKEMLFEAIKKRFDKKSDTYDQWYTRIVRAPEFEKMVKGRLDEVKARYEISLNDIIKTSIEKFIKVNTK